MSPEISWAFEAVIEPGALDEYGALAREISADNQVPEPGQQIYEWFVDGQDFLQPDADERVPRAK